MVGVVVGYLRRKNSVDEAASAAPREDVVEVDDEDEDEEDAGRREC